MRGNLKLSNIKWRFQWNKLTTDSHPANQKHIIYKYYMKFHILLFLIIIIMGTETTLWLQADVEGKFSVVSVIKY